MKPADLNAASSYFVADWEVRPGSCEIARADALIKLEPRVMELLQFLASHPGEVLSRSQLEQQVWPDVVVGYDAVTKSIGKLREALGDAEKPARLIQTIPKKGYRLAAPVTLTRTSELPESRAPSAPSRSRTILILAIAAAMASLAVAVFIWSPGQESSAGQPLPALTIAGKPKLLVLPLRNLNQDPREEYFSRGITDDLIVGLSHYSAIDVVASRIAFQYAGREVSAEQLTGELGVRYVVDGSIRRTPQNMRINLQLFDAHRGINLWARQYNRPVEELFSIQDEVRGKIINALAIEPSDNERAINNKRYTNSFRAYDSFLRGQSNLIKRADKLDNLQAREYFEQAIAIDPNFARAYAALAMVNTDAYRHKWVADPDVAGRIALFQAEHALKLDPDSSYTNLAMGYVQFFIAADHEAAAQSAEKVLKLEPKNSDATMLLATIYVHAGKPEKAEAYVESSMRLNADAPSIYYGIGGLANLLTENYQVAHALYSRSLLINPERMFGKVYMTILLVRMGRMDEAEWFATEITNSDPEFNATDWAGKQPYKDKRINQRLREDLRQAGL